MHLVILHTFQKLFILIVLLLLSLSLHAQDCNTRTWSGVAKYHNVTDAITACGYNPMIDDTMYAALRDVDYQSGRFCNTCLKVSSAKGSVIVKVMDQSGSHGLDIHKKVFAKLGDTLLGNVDISWQITDCPEKGNIGYFYSADSHESEKKIMVVDSKTPIAKFFFRYQDDPFIEIKRTDGNANDFFVLRWTDHTGTGPFDFMVEDVYGRTITDYNIAYASNTTFYGENQLPQCDAIIGISNKSTNIPKIQFPNPSSTNTILRIESTSNELFTINIHEVDGKVVLENTIQANTDYSLFQNLRKGIYILILSNKESIIQREKFIID